MTLSIRSIFNQFDRVLRGGVNERPRLRSLVIGAAAAALGYGLIMGSYGLETGSHRFLQVLFSGIKVPLLLLITFGLCIPSFFVINTLAGLREDFGAALRALLTTQCALTLVLLSLAPLTAVWYLSDRSYDRAILFNAAMFGVASLAAQFILKREYRPLIQQRPRHRVMLRIWLAMYAFVGIQMGWVLRPFIGKTTLSVRFFREDAWGNAYVQVFELVAKQLGF